MLAVIGLWFRTNPRNIWFIAGLIALTLAAGWLYLKGRTDNAKAERARDAIAVQAAIKSDTRANAKAAEVVAHDAILRVRKEKELADAVAPIIDVMPDAVAVRSGCCELQQNGISVADLPQCLAPDGRPPTCANR